MASVVEYRASKMLDMFVNKHSLKLEIKSDKFSIEVHPGLEVSSPESVEMLKFLGFAIKYREADEASSTETQDESVATSVNVTPPSVALGSEPVALAVESRIRPPMVSDTPGEGLRAASVLPTTVITPTEIVKSEPAVIRATEIPVVAVAGVVPPITEYKTPKFGA